MTTYYIATAAFGQTSYFNSYVIGHRLTAHHQGPPSRYGIVVTRNPEGPAPERDSVPYGDVIRAARMVAFLAAHAKSGFVLAVPRALVRLFSGMGIPIVDQEEGNSTAAKLRPGVHMPRFEHLPFPPPLWADPTIRLPTDGTLRVGLCWHGSGANRSAVGLDDDVRSVPSAALRSLLDVPGIAWVGLQLADHARELPIQGLDTLGVRDFADTAGILQQLDLVITIDTSVVHLAGNLCVPTWLLLASNGDAGLWNVTPPLYPTVRPFRQATPGDWTSVISEVRTQLAERAALHKA